MRFDVACYVFLVGYSRCTSRCVITPCDSVADDSLVYGVDCRVELAAQFEEQSDCELLFAEFLSHVLTSSSVIAESVQYVYSKL